MRSRAALLALALLASVAAALPFVGCGASQTEAQQGREYGTRGVIRGVDAANLSVTIQHEDVPDYMPAMTMPFALTNASQVSGIVVGDAVTFRFRAESGGRHVIVAIAKR